MIRKPSRRFSLTSGTAALLLLASLAGTPADAQTIHLFPCKVVCGYELGNVRLLNDTSPLNQPYEDLKPGNYATVCNLFNYDIQAPAQTVLPYIAVEGAGLIFLGPVNVPLLTNLAYGCVDIITSLGNPPLNGTVFEGYLTFFTFDPDFHGDGVRTYSSQNAFERHDVRLILTAGDNIYAGRRILGLPIASDSGDEDDDWFFTFFQPYRYMINRIPVYPCIGNHDTGETEDHDDREQLLDNMYLRERVASEEVAGRASMDPGLFSPLRVISPLFFAH